MNSINPVLASLFILVSLLVISALSGPNRWKALLGTSLLFYYLVVGDRIVIVLLLALVTYVFGRLIRRSHHLFWIALILLLTPLMLYKISGTGDHFDNYQLQTLDNLSWNKWSTLFQIVGISYFTFNSISYLVDIRRKYIDPERNFFRLLLYLVYFPAIFSGPLHRGKYLFERFRNIEVTEYSITRGLRLILWAIFKNVVIAQRIFVLITLLKNSDIGGPWYLILGLLFYFYLYCNFSSFIDFFRGVSLVVGIEMKQNFNNRVYFASSRQEFWKGWHITLNEWFRDYFFFTLSGYDKERKYTDLLLLITFLLIALWHELSTVLLVWGLLNGLWIVIEKKFDFRNWSRAPLRKVAGVIYHLSVASVLALIFISPEPGFLYDKILVQPAHLPPSLVEDYLVRILIVIFCFLIMDFFYVRAKGTSIDEYLEGVPLYIRWITYFNLMALILIFGYSPAVENYYIQF